MTIFVKAYIMMICGRFLMFWIIQFQFMGPLDAQRLKLWVNRGL